MRADKILKHRDWVSTGNRNGWRMTSAPSWKRFPIVRHVRAAYGAYQVAKFQEAIAFMGSINTGYDEWVLYGIYHGLEQRR